MGKRNPVAFALRTPAFRQRKTKTTKGKGAYTRKPRHRTVSTDGVFFISNEHYFLFRNGPMTTNFLSQAK
jgi:stalled ribosome alternative rescue factor ArfA